VRPITPPGLGPLPTLLYEGLQVNGGKKPGGIYGYEPRSMVSCGIKREDRFSSIYEEVMLKL